MSLAKLTLFSGIEHGRDLNSVGGMRHAFPAASARFSRLVSSTGYLHHMPNRALQIAVAACQFVLGPVAIGESVVIG